MITVYVREAGGVGGQVLGEFEPHYLPVVVAQFKEWPTYFKNSGTLANGVVTGQFAQGHDGCYFEIIVAVKDAD